MINQINEILGDKTIDQYKIIEDRYLTLKRYLRLFVKENRLLSKVDIELIISALENEPIVEEREEEHE